MRPLATLPPLALLLAALAACDYAPTDPVGDSGLDDSGLSAPDAGRPGRGGDDGAPADVTAGWTRSAHPCFGNRTDAMWFDGRDTVWVGCGSTTEGTGLFRSDDGGATWASAGAFFDRFRVSSIQRADDGLLYVAGLDTTSAARVVALAPDGALTVVHLAGTTVETSFHVGTFRRSPAGLMVAESLTGGLIGSRLANVPGASRTFRGTIGSYATEVKRSVLGVTAEQVVSAECARQMAEAARDVLGADVGIAVTGVAGPDEQDDQPVGTVWFGLAIPGLPTETVSTRLPGDRERIRQFSTISVLNLLRMRLDALA